MSYAERKRDVESWTARGGASVKMLRSAEKASNLRFTTSLRAQSNYHYIYHTMDFSAGMRVRIIHHEDVICLLHGIWWAMNIGRRKDIGSSAQNVKDHCNEIHGRAAVGEKVFRKAIGI
jgi:hypothetical protein